MNRYVDAVNMRTPREIWTDLWRAITHHKWLIVLVQIGTILSAYGWLQLTTERYLAEAQLLVKLGRENVDGPLTAARGVVTTMGVREEEVNSNISLLSSRSLVQDVVDEIGEGAFDVPLPLPRTPLQAVKYQIKTAVRWGKRQYQEALIALQLEKRLSSREKAVTYCHQNLSVERTKSSDVIVVRLWLPDPQLATRFLETLVERYLERHVRARAADVPEEFFAEQVRGYQLRLEELDEQLVALRDQSQLASIERQRELLLSRMHAVYEQLDESQNELELLHKSETVRTASAEPSVDTTPAADKSPADSAKVIPSTLVAILRDRIVALHLEKSRLTTVEGDDALRVQVLNEELQRCETKLERILLARIAQFRERITAFEKRLAELNDGERQVDELTRERDVAERNYVTYTGRMEDSRISRELDRDRVANVAVLTPPVASAQPVFPKKKTVALVSIAAGLLLGIGAALAVDYFDDTVYSHRDLAAIEGWTVLGQVHLRLSSPRVIRVGERPRRQAIPTSRSFASDAH